MEFSVNIGTNRSATEVTSDDEFRLMKKEEKNEEKEGARRQAQGRLRCHERQSLI
jgi:hypothetical protein